MSYLLSSTFLHLTVQEYLAALYWSRYPADQQPKRFLDSQIIKCLSFNSLNSLQHEKHRPFCLFFAGLANIKDYVDLNKINKTIFIDNKHFAIPQMCELLFEAQSTDPFSSSSFKMPNSDFYYDYMNILSAPLESFTLAYCFIKNSINTTTWSFTITEKEQLQQLADGMHSISSSDWDERNGPIVRMHLTRNVNDILEVFPSLYPFTKSITVLNLSGDLNDKGVDIMKKLSYYCPRLTSLLITRNSSRPSFTKMFQLPPEVDLTNVTLYIPYDDVLLDNLHQYQAMNELHLYPDTMRYAHYSFYNKTSNYFSCDV